MVAKRINSVFIAPGHNDPGLRLWCAICMRFYKQIEETGQWACFGCGHTYKPPQGGKTLQADNHEAIIAGKRDGEPVPGDFSPGCKVISDKEISPIDGEERELEYSD